MPLHGPAFIIPLIVGFLIIQASSFPIPAPRPLSNTRLHQTALDKVYSLYENAPEPTEYDQMITSMFPGALSNKDLETRVVYALAERGFTDANTLLGTSLCADELARRLEDDFVTVFGNNFNLGGLSGFPFAGNIGFENLALHVPDDGAAFIVYGPHVGVSTQGQVGVVERAGITNTETCCTSAISAYNYLSGNTDDGATESFTDLQQSAVQNQLAPQMERLYEYPDPMLALPYLLFETQDQLMSDIVQAGCGGIKNCIALLGGIQINTAPQALDYFVPIRFELLNNQGQVMEDMLSVIQ